MSSRDLAVAMARLERLRDAAAALLAHAPDLHGLGYERAVRGREPVRDGGPPAGVETVGNPRARAVWLELEREVAAADKRLGAIKVKALNLLSEGPPSPAPTRGSLLREEEFDESLERAEGRGGPARLVPQPGYPNAATKPKKKGRRK